MSTIKVNNVYLNSWAVVVNKMENEGPLKIYFDKYYDDLYCQQKTFEKAERRLVQDAIDICLDKVFKSYSDVEYGCGGDLLNQIISSNYIAKDFTFPYLGTYAACATSMLSVGVMSLLIEGNFINNALCFTSSHNATAERQYRYPTEYGIQKKETTNYTVTSGCCGFYSNQKSPIRVKHITFGKVIDMQKNDPNDMGSAMAPAAFDTLTTHLNDLKIAPDFYDYIITGDLATVGSKIFLDLCQDAKIEINNHLDCGLLIYDRNKQEVFSGGSGCGCCPSVFYSYFTQKLLNKEIKKILVIATGALLSPIAVMQKENIPCVAHAVSFEVE